MTRQSVARLYDALHRFESRYRRSSAYPVHKTLRFDEPSVTDIYDWIVQSAAGPGSGRVLDAGCGVGYGALRLAAGGSGPVTGISLSEAEIRAARAAAAASPLAARLDFAVCSFDDPPAGPYDLIIAVESLKHSADLAATRDALWAELAPGGQLIIVDDCYAGPPGDPRAVALCEAWHLARLYTQADFGTWPAAGAVRETVLDAHVAFGGALAKARRRLGALARAVIKPAMSQPVAAAFRGGECLEALYASGLMHYVAFIVDKPPAGRTP